MPPYVALESTVIAHGLPYPENYETACRLEAIVREEGAIPKTVGLVQGQPIAGLSDEQIRYFAQSDTVHKVSLRDLSTVVARGLDGATTVATTMWIAHRAQIPVFATGGIGGVHRGTGPLGTGSFDISADLEALARIPMIVVCAGPKAILDLPATCERLETLGVPLVGYQTDEMPAFYSRTSGLSVDVRCDTPEEVAALAQARTNLGLSSALLVTVPIPEAAAIPASEIEPSIEQALADAKSEGLTSAAVTPFLLSRLSALTGKRSLQANLALLQNNARIAAQIACALNNLNGLTPKSSI